jgi:DNA polymerase III epsilon subunit-like protein
MVENYFDIETTGTDPERDKVICIQVQRLEGRTTLPIGEIRIFKEWESSEEEILKEILPYLLCENPFDFIMVGKNLLFDFNFINQRAMKYGIGTIGLDCIYNRAFIDLKHVLVLMNDGAFRGYNNLLKEGKYSNKEILDFYKQGKYNKIIEYVKEEAEIFREAYLKIKKELPSLKNIIK